MISDPNLILTAPFIADVKFEFTFFERLPGNCYPLPDPKILLY